MRISDWSSDVCSSDLQPERGAARHRGSREAPQMAVRDPMRERLDEAAFEQFLARRRVATDPVHHRRLVPSLWIALLSRAHPRSFISRALSPFQSRSLDRKSVVWGKSVAVRVDIGGRRLIQKKKKQ